MHGEHVPNLKLYLFSVPTSCEFWIVKIALSVPRRNSRVSGNIDLPKQWFAALKRVQEIKNG